MIKTNPAFGMMACPVAGCATQVVRADLTTDNDMLVLLDEYARQRAAEAEEGGGGAGAGGKGRSGGAGGADDDDVDDLGQV